MLNFSRWKIAWIACVCLLGILAAFPNFLSEEQAGKLPGFMFSDQVSLGLDLQGGSYLLLEVQSDIAVGDRVDDIQADARTQFRRERIRATNFVQDETGFIFTLRDPADTERARKVLDDMAQPIINVALIAPAKDIFVTDLGKGRFRVALTEQGLADLRRNVVQQSIEVVRRRVDELGTREPTIQQQGSDRILVQVPGLKSPDQLIELLGKTARLTFHLVNETVTPFDIQRGTIPRETMVLPSADGGQIAVLTRAMVTGENLNKANVTNDQYGRPAVGFQFDLVGAKKFGKATSENVGRAFAIVLDDLVISYPVIRGPILGGSGIIEGNFTYATAGNLVALLNAGALPVPLTILEQRTVGAELGSDSIEAGKIAAVVGFLAVMLFIVLSYGTFGVAADIALMINVALIMGLLSVLPATLTLPGIAGIVLTIGMAVDANVLIFERIREELREGKIPLAAVENGYRQAMSTILDANITTLIAAIILFQYGTGPVKGFAVTLAIGIVTSVFAAVTVTRLIVVSWLRWKKPAELKV